MLKRFCDLCGRVITDDIVKVEDPKILMSKLNPCNIGITCPRDSDWDLCPSCRETLYSWVEELQQLRKEHQMSKPTLNDMRLYILDKYSGLKWKERVYKMKPNQVAAIYKNIKKREALEKENPGAFFVSEKENYHQIDMFEYLLLLKGEKR